MIWKALLITCSLCVSLTALQAEEGIHRSPTLAKIQQRGELRVEMHTEDTAPFFYTDSNKKFTGFEVELVELIAKELDVKLRIIRKEKTFDKLVEKINSGEADLTASALYPSPKRDQYAYFSDPYWRSSPIVLINRVSASKWKRATTTLDSINMPQVKIGIRKSNLFRKRFEMQFAKASFHYFETRPELIKAAQAREVDVVLIDDLELIKWKSAVSNLGLHFQTIRDSAYSVPISLAMPWKDPHFQYWINGVLHHFERDGVMDLLRKKYLEAR